MDMDMRLMGWVGMRWDDIEMHALVAAGKKWMDERF